MSSKSSLLLFASGLVLFLGIAGLQLPELNRQREELHLVDADVIRNAPPEYAVLTTALGGFRGLLSDVLWLRSVGLERDNRLFELVQIYDWIGKLEPRIPQIWVFNSYNLAYNIAAAMPRREDRWLWVQRGVDLLMFDGLRYNPGSFDIVQQIAWLYLNKIGGRSDDFHWHFKTHLALKMQRTLGRQWPDLKLMADPDFPSSWEALSAQHPELRPLVSKAKSLGIDLARLYGPYLWDESTLSPEQLSFLKASENQEILNMVNTFYARQNLWKNWRMEPGRMLRLQQKYGRVDWRLADAVAFYWASLARELAFSGYEKELGNRLFYSSLVNLFRRGRLFLQPQRGKDYLYINQPELSFAEPLHQYFLEAIKEAPKARYAHQNFLEELVYTLALYNRKPLARHYFQILRKLYPERKYQVPFEYYLLTRTTDDIKDANYEQTVVTLNGLLRQSYWFLAMNDFDAATGYNDMAESVWKYYMASANDTEERLALPPLKQLRGKVLDQALNEQTGMLFPPLLREKLRVLLKQNEKKEKKEKK